MAAPGTQGQQNRRPTQAPLEREDNGIGFEEASQMEILSSSALQAIEGAQSQAQVATAHQYRRPSIEAIRKELEAWVTVDEETATECFYSLRERQGTENKPIEGPSARFAEIAMAAYGNMRAGAQTIENDGKRIRALGVAWDLERNNAIQMSADRSITNKQGRTYSMDMQITTAMAANSIAYRNAVLKVIPPNYWKPAYKAALRRAAGVGPIDQRFQDVVKAYRVFGVTEPMLLTYLDVATVKDLKDDHIKELRGLFSSLRDGQTTVQEAFKGIERDGTTKPEQAEQNQQANEDPGQQEQPKEPVADDTKGPFEGWMFGNQIEELYVLAKKNQHVSNNAQFLALAGSRQWEGRTMGEFKDMIRKPKGAK